MSRARITVASTALVIALTACAPPPAPEVVETTLTVTSTQTETSTAPPPPPSAAQRVPDDLRAKVASLIVVGVANYDQARFALDQGVGGLFIPSWADPALLVEPGRDINALRAEYDRPFSVAVDFEGGRVQRHTQVFGQWMPPRALAGQPDEVIQGSGYDIGRSLRERGVNVDYAPLLDLDVTGLDIIGDRSFGAEPGDVARVGGLFSQGLIDAGVTPTFKHFPGHGRATGDTHLTLATTPPLDVLEGSDMQPYAEVLPSRPTASVMMGHMIVPGLGGGDVPSSLNPEAYRILREGDYPGGEPFDGVIVTDDLSGMRGITDYRPTPEAVRDAIAAGADQALWSSGEDLVVIIDLVTSAATDGTIAPERIEAAAVRTQQQLIDVGL
ncbi:glycoside hydrolase family 3 protein [Corynebacterium sanguinis]|uniref:glycoside hydrolase family 3 N-terminal domain-containing protein n=1 Tax=Corynebacterium sanguinis TaxID=2594913 RepID=UPI00223AA531|nr:glycoside hydrolase family 3 N-terminal domain-containing protein [Corynebacterium sanguinis]MCT1628082.1 glycoside hydrolase family 3 protein [Corynebacterium sanguinis]